MANMVPPARLRACLIVAGALCAAPAVAQPASAGLSTGPSTGPSAAQPAISPTPAPPPGSPAYAPPKPGSPVVEGIVERDRPALEVRKRAGHAAAAGHRRRHVARRRGIGPLERPALAGVELLGPAPPAPEPPHLEVPMPAYPLDSVAAALFEPPPPIVCHRAPRIPDVPDPHLYREVTLQCAPDNP